MKSTFQVSGLLCLVLVVGAAQQSARGQGGVELKAIKGLSQQKLRRVQRLARRYREQQRKLMTLPDSAKLIKLRDELDKLCSAADLVAITFSEDNSLSQAAFNLLQGPRNKKLKLGETRRLLEHIVARDPKDPWKALWASGVLGPNQQYGVPALIKLLRSSTDAFVLVHAAGGLSKQKGKIKEDIWRRAVEVLLKALGNSDDTAREAHNYMPRMEPWMRQWLIDRLLKAKPDAPYWTHGMSLLSTSTKSGSTKILRAVFLRALKSPKVGVRMSGVVGLRDQGLTRADLKICQRIARDKDPNVRRTLYAGLSQVKKPWAAPLLMAGLKDPSLDSVAESAYSLMELGYRPAVPRLIAYLRKTLKHEKNAKPLLHNAFRISAEAAVKLAGLEGYDFERRYERRGNRHMHATVIVNRDDHYRREARRLFRWWDTRGRRKRWR